MTDNFTLHDLPEEERPWRYKKKL